MGQQGRFTHPGRSVLRLVAFIVLLWVGRPEAIAPSPICDRIP